MSEPFTITRRVAFAETDMAGVLHFANYYRYMEEAEHAFWRSIGENVVTQDNGQAISWPRVLTTCEYHAPAHFEDELSIQLSVVKVGDRSVNYDFSFRRDEKEIAKGRVITVCCAVAPGEFRAVSIPDGLREKLERAVCRAGVEG